jgi:hypothetical protein
MVVFQYDFLGNRSLPTQNVIMFDILVYSIGVK